MGKDLPSVRPIIAGFLCLVGVIVLLVSAPYFVDQKDKNEDEKDAFLRDKARSEEFDESVCSVQGHRVDEWDCSRQSSCACQAVCSTDKSCDLVTAGTNRTCCASSCCLRRCCQGCTREKCELVRDPTANISRGEPLFRRECHPYHDPCCTKPCCEWGQSTCLIEWSKCWKVTVYHSAEVPSLEQPVDSSQEMGCGFGQYDCPGAHIAANPVNHTTRCWYDTAKKVITYDEYTLRDYNPDEQREAVMFALIWVGLAIVVVALAVFFFDAIASCLREVGGRCKRQQCQPSEPAEEAEEAASTSRHPAPAATAQPAASSKRKAKNDVPAPSAPPLSLILQVETKRDKTLAGRQQKAS